MGWAVNNLPLRVILQVILEGIGDIRDTNNEVLCGIDENNKPGCGCFQDCRGGLVKSNAFNLGFIIFTMAWEVTLDVVTDLLDGWG